MTSPIAGLAYVVVGTSSLDRWREFGTNVLGTMESSSSSETALHLRCDDHLASFIVSANDGPLGLRAAGWQVRGEREWSILLERLERCGIPTEEDPRAVSDHCVTDLRWVTDPSGNKLELVLAPLCDPITNFVSPRGVRFVTGEQGLGHLTLAVAQYRDTVEFYTRVLGFHVRETIDLGIRATFASCNSRQHAVALIDGDGTNRLHHVMVEVDALDDVGRCWDRVVAGAAELSVGLGRHWNDHMISFYMKGPDDFPVEYGYGGRRVDAEEWTETRQGGRGGPSLWGHHPVDDKDPAFAAAHQDD